MVINGVTQEELAEKFVSSYPNENYDPEQFPKLFEYHVKLMLYEDRFKLKDVIEND